MNYRQVIAIMILAISFSTTTAYGEGQAIKLKEPPDNIEDISTIIFPSSIENIQGEECTNIFDSIPFQNPDRIIQYESSDFDINYKSEFYIWSEDKKIRDMITQKKFLRNPWDGLDLGSNITGKVRLCLGGSAYDDENFPIDNYNKLYLWSYRIKNQQSRVFRDVYNYISWYPPYKSCNESSVVIYNNKSLMGILLIMKACREAYNNLISSGYSVESALFFGKDGQIGVCRSN